MKLMKDNIIVVAISTAILAVSLLILSGIIKIFILSGTVAIVSYPLFKRIRRYVKNNVLSSLIVVFSVFLILLSTIFLSIYIIYLNWNYLIQIGTQLESYANRFNLLGGGQDGISSTLVELGTGFIESVELIVFNSILFFVFLFALLNNSDNIKSYTEKLTGKYPKTKSFLDLLYDRSYSLLYMLYVSTLVVAFATFVLALPLFWLLGYEKVFLLSIIAGLLELLPMVGPFIMIVIVFAHQLLLGNIVASIISLIYGILVVASAPEYILRPILIGRKSGISEFLVIVSMIGGIISLGVWGIVFGPLIVVLAKTVIEVLMQDDDRFKLWRRQNSK